MHMRRTGAQHQTRLAGVQSETYYEFRPEQRVMTTDGYPGRVIAVHDGPFPGAEDYEVTLDQGMGGGLYTAGQLQVLSEGEHTATADYPELTEILRERPDPAKLITYASKIATMPGPDEDEDLSDYCEDCNEEHTEEEGHRPCIACGERHQDLEDRDNHETAYTDWDEEYPRLGGTVHRGMEIHLDPEDHAKLHDETVPDSPRAHLLADHLAHGESLGMHWTENEDRAKHYAGVGGGWGPSDKSTHVVVHARTPDKDDIETDPDTLVNNRVYGIGYHDDDEIPIRNGAPVHVTGLSWKQPHQAEWTHHTFAKPLNDHLAVRSIATSINGVEIDEHGSAPHKVRAYDPAAYDRESTEGDPDPKDVAAEKKTTEYMRTHGNFDEQLRAVLPHAASLADLRMTAAGEPVDEDGLCAYPHDGPCPGPNDPPGMHHQAMPSRRYPDHPEGFHSEIEQDYPGGESRITGYHGNGRVVGTIDYHAFDRNGRVIDDNAEHPEDVHAIKVNMLHGYGHGGASAVMDHLYNKHPNALINHGYRTHEGLRWWRSYDEPDPDRNVHNIHPQHWSHIFDPSDVGDDIRRNEHNDPGHHSDEHDVDWAVDHDYGDYDDEDPYDDEKKDKEEEESEEEEHDPDPRDMPLSHGMAIHLHPNDHAYVHNPDIPSEHRARRLLEAIGHGNMPTDRWHDDKGPALSDAYNAAAKLREQSPHNRVPPTQVTLHAAPFKHDEVHTEDSYGDAVPQFTSSPQHRRVDFQPVDKPINFHLYGMNWSTHNDVNPSASYGVHHFRDQYEPVGMQMSQYQPSDLHDTHLRAEDYADRREMRQEHEQRYAPRHGPLNPSGTGEQQKLFAKRIEADEHHYREPEMPDAATATSPIWGGSSFPPYDPENTETAEAPEYLIASPEQHADPKTRPTRRVLDHTLSSFDPYAMIRDAALDEEFKFHVTASWRDVRAKAKRIRAEGKVRITMASEGVVFGEVQGDHHTYESGIQRLPGSRQAVATYSCGCKWGSYHWGAADDFSRFAGRMCSHALALQFEAQSRGMFGKDVLPDSEKPNWVPNRVVVKYDIDSGTNQFARSSAKDESPLRVFLATVQDDGLPLLLRTAGIDTRYAESSTGLTKRDTQAVTAGAPHEAAANDPFGGMNTMVDVPPKPYGATMPRDPFQSPASAGFASQPDPDNWAEIDPNSYLTHKGSRQDDDAIFEPVVSTMASDPYMTQMSPEDPGGLKATLHDEPEPALPETDGNVGDMGNESLSPEDPSIQTIGIADGGGDSSGAIGGDDEIGDIVENFQSTAAAKALQSGSGAGHSDGDIAEQARRVLAMKEFTPLEQQELIREGEHGSRASNLDRLELTGTHYVDDDEDDLSWLS